MSFKTLKVSSGNSIYLKLEEGTSRIRIVSEPIEIWTIFNRAEKTAKKYLDEELLQNDVNAKDARKRFAMWVIDRKDGEMRMAEVGQTIANALQVLANDPDYGFDTIPPYDIKITKSGSGLDTEYTVMQSPASPLTLEEKSKIMQLENVAQWFAKQPNVITKRSDMSDIPF